MSTYLRVVTQPPEKFTNSRKIGNFDTIKVSNAFAGDHGKRTHKAPGLQDVPFIEFATET